MLGVEYSTIQFNIYYYVVCCTYIYFTVVASAFLNASRLAGGALLAELLRLGGAVLEQEAVALVRVVRVVVAAGERGADGLENIAL